MFANNLLKPIFLIFTSIRIAKKGTKKYASGTSISEIRYGRRLVLSLLDELRARNFMTVFAGVTVANEASSKLWASLGFTPVGIFRRAGFKLGVWQDVEWWQLTLSDEPAPRGEPGSR